MDLRQKGAPVDELEQAGGFVAIVGIGHHGSEKSLVTGEVLTPEADHQGARQDGHVLILLVGGGVQVHRLQHRVEEHLGLQVNLLLWLFL